MSDTLEAPAGTYKAGQIVTYAGRTGLVVAVVTTHADGSPILKADATNPLAIDRATPECAYRIAWFESVSDPIAESVITVPHPSEL